MCFQLLMPDELPRAHEERATKILKNHNLLIFAQQTDANIPTKKYTQVLTSYPLVWQLELLMRARGSGSPSNPDHRQGTPGQLGNLPEGKLEPEKERHMTLQCWLLNQLSVKIGGTWLMMAASGTDTGSLKFPANAGQGGE